LKFLIVGASGFVGQAVYRYLQKSGHELIGSKSKSTTPGLITFDLLNQRIQDCVPESFFTSGEPVVTVICAGIPQIVRCYTEQQFTHEVNVVATIKLIEELGELNSRTVFLSSNFVFDGNTGNYADDHPRNPISEYGRHKEAVERFVEANAPDTLVMRMDKLVGDDPDDQETFSQWYGWIKDGKPIMCISDQSFAPTYVKDVGRAVEISCQMGLTGIYNVSNSELFSRIQLADRFIETLGVDAEIVSKPQSEFGFQEMRPGKGNLNATRFASKSQIEFTPIQEVLDIFARTVRIKTRTNNDLPTRSCNWERSING